MRHRYPTWTVPAISGALIVISLIVARFLPWLGDATMIAAAVVAGVPVVVKAYRSLAVKTIGIDLLVAVAAVGAIVINLAQAIANAFCLTNPSVCFIA